MPSLLWVFNTLMPKQRNFFQIWSSTLQYLAISICIYPALDMSSHKTVQLPYSPQDSSLDPTNCHMEGPKAVFWAACKETRAGKNLLFSGNSYQMSCGNRPRVSLPGSQPRPPRMKALFGVHKSLKVDNARAEPPSNLISVMVVTESRGGRRKDIGAFY